MPVNNSSPYAGLRPDHGGTRVPGGDDEWAVPLMAAARLLGPADLIGVVRLLLLCKSAAERRLVGLTAWHGRSVEDAAAAVGLATGRAAEVLDSVRVRVAAAVAREAVERRLAAVAGDRERARASRRTAELERRANPRNPGRPPRTRSNDHGG